MEPHRARSTWLWNYAYRASPLKRQNSAIPIPSGNTIVAVPDGQLGRRLIGVEYLRQGWGRKRTGTAGTGRPATDQPTPGKRTPAHAAVPIGTWRPGPDERRSVAGAFPEPRVCAVWLESSVQQVRKGGRAPRSVAVDGPSSDFNYVDRADE